MKQITVYGLLSKIYNYNGNIPMPKKICFCGYDYEWDEDFNDYIRKDDKNKLAMSFLENHADNLQYFLQDTVDILDDEIEKIPRYSLEKIQKAKNKDEWREERIILLEKRINDQHIKINELIDVINEMKKGE